MSSENSIRIDSYAMYKVEDGYRNITMADNDPGWHAIVHQAMEAAGYTSYGMNRTGEDGKITFTFVTHAMAAVLKERHMHSCRNSLSTIIPGSLGEIVRKLGDLPAGSHEALFKTVTVPITE